MEAFATVEDYEARYGAVDDEARVSTLLSDASAFIAAQPGFAQPTEEPGASNLVRVTCAVVYRSLVSGAWAGLSSVSQGVDGYSASASVYNPSGDFYLTKAEKSALGIGQTLVSTVRPAIHDMEGVPVW